MTAQDVTEVTRIFRELQLCAPGDKSGAVEAFKGRLEALESRVNNGGGSGAPSVGERFIESKDWREFYASKQPGKRGWEAPAQKTFTNLTVPMPPTFVGLVDFVHPPTAMRSVLPATPTGGPAVSYLRATNKTVTGSIIQIAQGDLKATATWEYVEEVANVVTFAETTKVSVQCDEDTPALRQAIDGELVGEVDAKEDLELLTGPGTTGRMLGFLTAVPAFTGGVVGDSSVNVIQRAIAIQAGKGYPTTAVILPVSGALAISLIKDTTGRAIYPNTAALPWTARTITSSSMPDDKFLLGDFLGFSTLYDRSERIDVGLENDDFSRNLFTVRYDRRSALAIKRVEAFLQGSLTPPATI